MNLTKNTAQPLKPVNSPAQRPPFFQPKLTINQPNDVYEQEADHMADRVMRMADPSAVQNGFFKPATSSVQRKCKACEEEGKHLHRKESSAGEVHSSNELNNYISNLSSSGHAMPESSRKFFEPRFGHDFSNVKIHTDAVAAKSAQSINALAYTTGNHVVFNQGQYSPGTEQGQRLMAHELTHVVQQGGASGRLQKAPAATPIKEHGDVAQVPDDVAASCNIAETSPADEQRINYETNTFTLNDATRSALDDFARRWNEGGADKNVRVDGYASTTGNETLNWRLSCSRANTVIQELIKPSDGGKGIPVQFLNMFAHGATNRFSQTAFPPNQTATLTSEIKIKPVPPKVKPQPVPPQPDPPKDEKICGPKIDNALKRVLGEVAKAFLSWDVIDQVHNCDSLTSIVMVTNEWDIEQLHFEAIKPNFKGCGIPEKGEDEKACSQTVEVDGKCFLAGTVNYVLWGLICRLCNMRFGYPSHSTMENLVWLYNRVGADDPGPPGEWAEIGWKIFSGTAPPVGNRSSCQPKCPHEHTTPFSWQWLPTHKGFNF
jgi:outer membrane protein OmpA-like peptidoglycan-associated protein